MKPKPRIFRRVVLSPEGSEIWTLECGHKVKQPYGRRYAKKISCPECAAELHSLTEVSENQISTTWVSYIAGR